jgi:hypothetical protein
MVHTPARRTLLASVGTGLTALLAGCGGSDSGSSPTGPAEATPIREVSAEMTRSSADRPPIVALPDDAADGVNADGSASTPDRVFSQTIESASEAAALELAEEATNGDAVRRLLSETAYGTETVFAHQTQIRECYRLRLNYVSRDPDGDPDLQFCQVIRDAHTPCERETREYVAAFVRLPFPRSEFGGYSVGRGSSCDPVPPRQPNGSESS